MSTPTILKTINFKNGVSVNLSKSEVILNYNGSISSIDSHMLDNYQYQEYWEPRISPSGLSFRVIGFAFVLFCCTTSFSKSTNWTFIGILIALVVLFEIVFAFDAILELNIFRGIIEKYFSNHCYYAKIGNKSGNNIEFFAFLDEKDKLDELNILIKNLKQNIMDRKQESSNNSLDDLQKLWELHQNGILTEQEFIRKKQEILK
jgi:hypothetical protein